MKLNRGQNPKSAAHFDQAEDDVIEDPVGGPFPDSNRRNGPLMT